MFKRVEDDVLLGVSKVITKKNVESNSLLIEDDIVDKADTNDGGDQTKSEEIIKDSYSLEDLINITNDNEKLIRSIIEKKDGLKTAKEKFSNNDFNENHELESESSVTNADDQLDDSNKENSQSNQGNDIVNRQEYNEMKEELLSSLKEHIGYLKEQIETKDKQLQNKDELIRNFQVLMKSDKDRIHELEAGKVDMKKEAQTSELEVETDVSSEVDEMISENEDQLVEDLEEEVVRKKRSFFAWLKK